MEVKALVEARTDTLWVSGTVLYTGLAEVRVVDHVLLSA